MSIAIKKLSKEDFEVDSIAERMKKVNGIIEESDEDLVNYFDNYYNPSLTQNGSTSENDAVSKELEKLADYLLYAENKEKRKENHGEDFEIVSSSDSDKNKQKEFLTDEIVAVSEAGSVVHQHKLYKKVKVNKSDREEFPELKSSGEVIENLKHMISTKVDSQGNPLEEDQIRKLKWILIEIRKDEVAVKECLKGYIRFKRLSPEGGTPSYEGVSFANVDHISCILENYSSLKEDSFDDTKGDIKHIIHVFEELVDATDFEDYIKEVLILKIDGVSRKKIVDSIRESYGISISESRISQLTKDVIPQMVVDTYLSMKEKWLYTHIIKGRQKQCSKCLEMKPATKKYFSPNKKGKFGLHARCRNCR